MIAQGPIAARPITALAGDSAPTITAIISAPSPLGAARVTAVHDFTGLIGGSVSSYVMDLVTPGGPVRVPISSWQATLRSSLSSYAQCVVPACAPWLPALNSATEFVISRCATMPSGERYEYVMLKSPIGHMALNRGPQRYTATLSGYASAIQSEEGPPPAVYDRALAGVRSIAVSETEVRARCAIDWLLRPGHRAFVDGSPVVVSYINFYVLESDAYCDVGGVV